MRDWYKVFTENKGILTFGFLFSFFSCFGQTFFVSLYVPYFTELLGISKTSFGTIYAVVTLLGAFLISFTGKYIDSMPLKKYSLLVFMGLILSMFLLSAVQVTGMLIIGLFLIRWLGQGLMSHTSSIGIAKYFTENRGKALSFSAMGHPAGNFLLPFIMLPLIAFTGWRTSLVLVSVLALVIMLPVIQNLDKTVKQVAANDPAYDTAKPETTEPKYFLTAKFWIIAVNIFILPFILTSVSLYQYSIGEANGWSSSWVAFSFSFFAIFSAVGLLISGNLIDKFTGLYLFPLYLLPALLGVIILFLFKSQFAFPVFFALTGFSSGLGSTVKTATQTEVYGISSLGKVRSYFSTIIVLSTALGPPVFAYFVDRSISLQLIMGFSAILLIISIAGSFRLWGKDLAIK